MITTAMKPRKPNAINMLLVSAMFMVRVLTAIQSVLQKVVVYALSYHNDDQCHQALNKGKKYELTSKD